jgi:hypothetical protein
MRLDFRIPVIDREDQYIGPHIHMYRIAVCMDCVYIIANGETGDGFDYDAWATGVEQEWPAGDGWRLGYGWSEDPEAESTDTWFSWSSCDGCGSHLGGDRQYCHVSRSIRAPWWYQRAPRWLQPHLTRAM